MIIKGLPKISLNKWYSGTHWSKRKKIKDDYLLVLKKYFPKKLKGIFTVEYKFTFKKYPLDASNCSAMIKLIEDCIFEKDGYKDIRNILISSRKGKEDKVEIYIYTPAFDPIDFIKNTK
jgi:type I restriction-modification system DNA methylase subunit